MVRARLGMCSVGWGDVFSFWPNVFSFWPDVFSFWPNVFTFEGHVFSFLRRAPLTPLLRQAQGRLFGDGGSGREAGGVRPGMCQLCRANVSSFWPDVSSLGGDVSSFHPNVSTLAGQVSSEEGERSEGREVRPEKRGICLGELGGAGVWFDRLRAGSRGTPG